MRRHRVAEDRPAKRSFAGPAWLALALAVAGCAGLTAPGKPGARPDPPALEIRSARLITDNDAAFQSKLDLIRGARHSLDVMYFIYSEDHSSSTFTLALLDAARRGVKVRLLVDYSTNYKHLDLFSMMEERSQGRLEVRFYNRPTRNIIRDAAYLTMGCGREEPEAGTSERCSPRKFARIDELFAGERIGGVPAAELNVSNLNVGNSGLLLSGLYARQRDAVALAVTQGQEIDLAQLQTNTGSASAAQKESLKRVGRIYWRSKFGSPFKRVQARVELFFAFSLFGDQLTPVFDTFTRYLPAEKDFSGQAGQDWNHFTDYLHHKLLLADETRLQMGGRNIENSYHMKPNDLTTKYVFMDTDLSVDIARGGERVAGSFEDLWSFTPMVATLAEVRRHAPNDFVANLDAYRAAEAECAAVAEPKAQEDCRAEHFAAKAKSLEERMADHERTLRQNAESYATRYVPHPEPSAAAPEIAVDAGAVLSYLENVPFDQGLPPRQRRRLYGAVNGREGRSGKGIHEAWVRGLSTVCATATADHPKTVVLHNAYFFPPSNLTGALARLFDGKADCSHVTVKVLTNSVETTDLSPVNLLARHWLKAFLEYYDSRDPKRRARYEHHEYRAREGQSLLSLHTKLALLGDELLIGSANADVRSYFMDSNNDMLLRNAPNFVSSYSAFVEGLLNDPARTRDITEVIRATPREQMLAEDRQALESLLARYRIDKQLDPQDLASIETRFVEILDDAYNLTSKLLVENSSQAAAEFNEGFKGI